MTKIKKIIGLTPLRKDEELPQNISSLPIEILTTYTTEEELSLSVEERVALGKERLRVMFLETDGTHGLYLDSDIFIRADYLRILKKRIEPIVNHGYPATRFRANVMGVQVPIGPVQMLHWGMGCTLVSREVLEQWKFVPTKNSSEDILFWRWVAKNKIPHVVLDNYKIVHALMMNKPTNKEFQFFLINDNLIIKEKGVTAAQNNPSSHLSREKV